MKGAIFLVFSLFIIETLTAGFPGKCPQIEKIKGFQPEKMAGKWHSIYETGKESACVCYEFEAVSKNHFHGYFYHLKQMVSIDSQNPENPDEGFVVSTKFIPQMDKMVMYTFATDYENYAGVFSCKEVGDSYYPHVAFWSRDHKMSDEKMEELKAMMAKYEGINLTELKAVNHSECGH
ncbi:insecticyanin-B-like [Chironomus tepperi]|uniref:insecticyanin-B-like n=1 Tax=Chironomus tepperi TaxID=113505 RepID=UPI00391F9B12